MPKRWGSCMSKIKYEKLKVRCPVGLDQNAIIKMQNKRNFLMNETNNIEELEQGTLLSANLENWVSELHKSVRMPRIQRGFVWKPQQIAMLWDSLLRGMPFGTLLVSKIDKPTQVKEGKKLISANSGWQLLDGQQRTRSIQGAFKFIPNESEFRVWLGIDKATNHKDMLFDVRVTTQTHPFGFDKEFKKFSLSTRRDAFKYFQNKYPETQLDLSNSQPFNRQGALYIPLDELLTNSDDLNGIFKKYEQDNFNLKKQQRLKQAIDKVKQTKVYSLCVSNDLFHFEEDNDAKGDDAEPGIEVLFKRIGTGGTTLSNNDYAYSLIKQRFENTYELIESILQNESANKLFSALDVVAIALRASCKLAKEGRLIEDSEHYSKNSIYRILHEPANTDYITRKLLQQKALEQAIQGLVMTVMYDEVNNTHGIPIQLLAHLPKAIWQVLIIHKINGYSFNPNELICFCLYWLFLKPNAKNTKKISKLLMNIDNSAPVIKNYINVIKNYYFDFYDKNVELARLDNFKATIGQVITDATKEDNMLIRCLHHILESTDNPKRDCNESIINFWYNKSLLIWLQRKYVNQLTSNTNSFLAPEITPYDFDHIIPQDYWARANTTRGRQFSLFVYNKEGWAKNQLGNSIGNYQLLSFTDNRHKSNKDYGTSQNLFNDEERSDYFYISKKVHDCFLNTPMKDKKWDRVSVVAFQTGTISRIIELYQEFINPFESLDYYFTPLKKSENASSIGLVNNSV